jgi:hypothetical protein
VPGEGDGESRTVVQVDAAAIREKNGAIATSCNGAGGQKMLQIL